VFPLTGVAPTERYDPLDCRVDVPNEDVDVKANLVDLRGIDGLKVDEWRLIGTEWLQAQPPRTVGSGLDDCGVEDGGPEGGDGSGVDAVDGDRPPGSLVVAYRQEGRRFVDDFAVESDELWSADGEELLLEICRRADPPDQRVLRVVTARQDIAKRTLLVDLGLVPAARWWVKELTPCGDASTWGPVDLGGVEAVIVPAPPVYDPGGPVCLLGDLDADRAGIAAEAAARHGAVLVIVQRERSPTSAPESEPALESAGFHNPSEFYDGVPSGT
jgi:hypothetical protein